MFAARGLTVTVTAFALAASPGHAVLFGGKNARTACYAVFDVDGVTATSPRVAECTDGDPSCDKDGTANDSCRFSVSVCVNQEDAGPTCIPPAPPGSLLKVVPKGLLAGAPLPALDSSGCGPAVDVDVPVKVRKGGRVKRPGKKQVSLLAVSPMKPKRDRDKVTLLCRPSPGGGTTAGSRCPANSSGPKEPNELLLTVAAEGTDLDNGWKGPSQNFPIPAGTQLQLCLEKCNASTDPTCDTRVPTGPGTFNKTTFGPPLPLFAAGIPACVVNEYAAEQANEVGTADLSTGAITGRLHLLSHVFITEEEKVCPKCVSNRCDSGPNAGGSCTVDGTVTVSESSAANKNFTLSKDCPPSQNTPAGVLVINLPLTTATSTLEPLPGGSPQIPCVAQPGEPRGIAPQADLCGAGTCTASCTGQACANPNGRDPVTGAQVCIDAKGGISQVCCSTDPTRACYPTKTGAPIQRVGKAEQPTPAWPDPTYPKTSNVVTVATFCEPATGTGSLDGLTGLPGPGAIILPAAAQWMRPAATP
jgi:hypothetical protein